MVRYPTRIVELKSASQEAVYVLQDPLRYPWSVPAAGNRIPPTFMEQAWLKLPFRTLSGISQRWRQVKVTKLERQELALPHREPGLPLY